MFLAVRVPFVPACRCLCCTDEIKFVNFIYNRACSVICVPTDNHHTNRFNHLIAHTRHDIDTFNQYKGMVFNAGISTVASMLQLGTSQVK